jgi:uncharacterized protein
LPAECRRSGFAIRNSQFAIVLAVCLALCLTTAAAAEIKVPELRGPVNDYAHVLDAGQAASLGAKLVQFQRQTSNQIAVLTVPSLGGEDIAGFSIRVADAWKIGYKGRDNGVLIVVAPNERRARIEAGYGLEGALPDAVCSRIIRDTMSPAFAAGKWYAGLDAAVDAMLSATKGEYGPLAGASRNGRGQPPAMRRHSIFGSIIMIVLFLLMISTRTGRQILFFMMLFGGRGGGGFGGGSSNDSYSGGGGSFGGGGASGSW